MSSRLHDPDRSLTERRLAVEGVLQAADRLGLATGDQPGVAGPEFSFGGSRRIALCDLGHGALEWRDDRERGPSSRSGARVEAPALVTLPVEELGFSELTARIQGWDDRLNPHQGLRRWNFDREDFDPIAAVPRRADGDPGNGRILLVLHGTFSSGEAIFDQLRDGESRAQFLAWARERYDHVLSFDHATLSVSPVLNAFDLARLFSDVRSPVDVVCHSRGGLVARWWLEAFGGARVGPRRAVFVSSPLGGTSLASPAKIRQAMNLFASVGAFLKAGGAAGSVFMPFLTIGTAMAGAFAMATGSLALSPISDLFFGVIPGLGSMSRVGNHPELSRLQSGSTELPPYFAIRSDFRLDVAGWKFWKHFTRPGLAQWGADRVFDQTNDLVVENSSAIELRRGAGLPPERVRHFEASRIIHHTNYFEQPEVADAIRRFLA